MEGMQRVLLYSLNMALVILLCQCSTFSGVWRRSLLRSNIRTPPRGTSTKMTSRQFNCYQALNLPIEYFKLNVTLNTSAILENPEGAQLLESAANRRWHFLTSLYSSYPVGDLKVEFFLTFNITPSGNCSFLFQEDSGNALTTIYPNISEMMSCKETMSSTICSQATKITTTPETIYESDNTTMNNTTPASTNGSKCLCPCKCANPMSKEKSDQMMAAILEDLRIPKYSTSFSKRKLSSAPDYRVSCTGIGLVGVFVMAAVFGVILVGDLNLLLSNARTALSHIRGHYGF